MSLDREYAIRRLDTLWQRDDLPYIDLSGEKKYILFSDLHLGNGGKADDFCMNEATMLIALAHYRKEGFELVLVGDIEELWQFALEEVRSRYFSTIYKAIRAFPDVLVHRIFGNHDGDWNKVCIDPTKSHPVQPGIAAEGIRVKNADGNLPILICHGHQGDIESDRGAWSSRFFVRCYRFFEPLLRKLGKKNPPAIRSQILKNHEKIFYDWAKANKVLLICGHTHRAIFASKSFLEKCQDELALAKAAYRDVSRTNALRGEYRREIQALKKKIRREKSHDRKITSVEPKCIDPRPHYFNTGSGIYDDGITGIELTADKIKLVKWHRDPKQPNQPPYWKPYEEADLKETVQRVLAP